MRWVNGFIHLLITLFLFCLASYSQTHGSLPTLVEGYQDQTPGGSATKGVIIVPENVSVGDLLFVGTTQDAVCHDGPFTISDTLANTWTVNTVTHNSTSSTVLQGSWTVVTTGGADTITVATTVGCDQVSVYARFKNTTGFVLDGSLQNSTTDAPTQTISTTNTTNKNGDLCVSIYGNGYGAGGGYGVPTDSTLVSLNGENGLMFISYGNAGLAGSYTFNHSSNGSQHIVMQTACFKPPTISIVTTKMPDAATGVAYSGTLKSVGGSGALTYSVVSGTLPTGMSLNASTGAITASNVTGTTQTVGFQVTDGSITSATKSLTITVGAAFASATIVQSAVNSSSMNSGATFALSTPSRCGDIIVVCGNGADTHGNNGWVFNPSGTSNNLQDSLGSPVSLLLPGGGFNSGPLVCYAVGPLTQSGNETFTVNNNAGSANFLAGSTFTEISGVQGLNEVGAMNTVFTAGTTGSVSASYTPPVANEELLLNTGSSNFTSTMTLSAPFSVLQTFATVGILGNDLAPSTSAVTGTTSVTGVSANTDLSTVLTAFRPALPPTGCATFTGQGEKIRRFVN